jgi:hypothetical protein
MRVEGGEEGMVESGMDGLIEDLDCGAGEASRRWMTKEPLNQHTNLTRHLQTTRIVPPSRQRNGRARRRSRAIPTTVGVTAILEAFIRIEELDRLALRVNKGMELWLQILDRELEGL